MKKIAMFTMGTRGDVQPYIFLAQELNKNGYDTLLGSHPCWKQLIESGNVKFVPIGPDIDIEKEAAIIRGKNKNPMLSMLKTMNFVFDIICDYFIIRLYHQSLKTQYANDINNTPNQQLILLPKGCIPARSKPCFSQSVITLSGGERQGLSIKNGFADIDN